MHQFVHNKKGGALVLVILVMVVLSILGVALLNVSLAEVNLVAFQEKKAQAYYLAHTGADALATYIVKNPDHLSYSDLQNKVNSLKGTTSNEKSYGNGSFTVKVDAVSPTSNDLKIESTGTVKGVSQKAIVTLLKRNPFDNVLYADENLTLWSGAKVYSGDIQYGGNIYMGNNAGVVGGDTIEGKLDYPENEFPSLPEASDLIIGNGTHLLIDVGTVDGSENIVVPPSNTEYLEKTYDKIEIDKNGSLTVKLRGETKRIVVRQMDVNGTLKVEGPGKLIIYVKEAIYFKGKVDSEAQNLFVYVGDYDSDTNTGNKGYIELKTGDSIFNGYIVGIHATVDVTANLVYTGAIIANTIKVASNAEVHYDAEHAPSIISGDIYLPDLGYKAGTWLK